MLTRSAALLALLVVAGPSAAQTTRPDPYATRVELGPESYTWQGVRQSPAPAGTAGVPQFGAARQMAADASARRAARLGLRRTAPTTAKPFNTLVHSPTVSPYLNLYRETEDEAAPNYYAFVRPQLEQQAQNDSQAKQLQSLQRQLQQATFNAPVAAPRPAARFGDTGRFYEGWRR